MEGNIFFRAKKDNVFFLLNVVSGWIAISTLDSSTNGKFKFKTDSKRSGLTLEKDTYVTSWEIDLMPEYENKILYKYTVSGPDGDVFTATSTLSRI